LLCSAHKEALAQSASRRQLHQEQRQHQEDEKDKLRNSNQSSKLQQVNSKKSLKEVKQAIESTLPLVKETKELNNNDNNIQNKQLIQNQTKEQKVVEISNKIETSQPPTSVTNSSPLITLDATNLDSNELKESSKFKVNISIPSNIVGILLVRRIDADVQYSVVNQIQKGTKTRISRVSPPPTGPNIIMPSVTDVSSKVLLDIDKRNKPIKKQSHQRRNGETDEGSSSDNDNSSNDSSSVDSDDYLDAEENPNNSPVTNVEAKPKQEITDVPFIIVGHTQESVDAASGYIQRIVSGERIKGVLSNLKLLTKQNYIKNQTNNRAFDRNITKVKPNKQKIDKNEDEVVSNIGENSKSHPKKSFVKKENLRPSRKEKSVKAKVDSDSNPSTTTVTAKKEYSKKKKVYEIKPQVSKP
jgi:hypothetical protein